MKRVEQLITPTGDGHTRLDELGHRMAFIAQQREALAERYYQMAIGAVKQAQAEQFADKSRLKKAVDGFTRSLQLNRRQTGAYIGMAYLYQLLGHPKGALPYLKAVLTLEPAHLDATQLLQSLLQQLQTPPAEEASELTIAESQPLHSAADYDALYDQVKLQMEKLLHQFSQQPSPSATADSIQLQALQTQNKQLTTWISHWESQLVILDHDMDVSELYQRLNVFGRLHSQYLQVTLNSARMMNLAEQLQQTHHQAHLQTLRCDDLQHYPAMLPMMEQQLELLMDHCDRLANELDWLEANQLGDIAPLMQAYCQLLAEVGGLQSALDAMAEHPVTMTESGSAHWSPSAELSPLAAWEQLKQEMLLAVERVERLLERIPGQVNGRMCQGLLSQLQQPLGRINSACRWLKRQEQQWFWQRQAGDTEQPLLLNQHLTKVGAEINTLTTLVLAMGHVHFELHKRWQGDTSEPLEPVLDSLKQAIEQYWNL